MAGIKEKENVFKYMEKQRKYFLRLYTIAEEMDKLANSRRNPKIIQKVMHNRLKTLKTFEFREQWFASSNNLLGLLEKFFKSPFGIRTREDVRAKIMKLMSDSNIYEGDLLKTTKEGLVPEIEKKTAMEINLPEVRKNTAKVVLDLRALMAIAKNLHILLQE